MWARRRRVRMVRSAMGASAAALLIFGLTGCGPKYTYLVSSSSESYLAVPHAWTVYGQKSIMKKTGSTGSFPYLAFFDDNRHPTLNDSLAATSEPWGVLRIRDLADSERETYSFDSLDNELIELDADSQAGKAQVVGNTQVLTHGSLRGIRQEIEVQSGSSIVLAEEAGYVNSGTTKAWALLVGCSSTCFNRNEAEINRVVHSWTVGKS